MRPETRHKITVLRAFDLGVSIQVRYKGNAKWWPKNPDKDFNFEHCEYRIRQPRFAWVNKYRDGSGKTFLSGFFPFRDMADMFAMPNRITKIKVKQMP